MNVPMVGLYTLIGTFMKIGGLAGRNICPGGPVRHRGGPGRGAGPGPAGGGGENILWVGAKTEGSPLRFVGDWAVPDNYTSGLPPLSSPLRPHPDGPRRLR